MAAPVIMRNASDAWVDETRPTKNFSNGRKMFVKASGNNQRFAYLFFAKPFPPGATILYAKLRVYNGSQLEGSSTVTVRRVTSAWGRNRIKWNNRPTTSAVISSQTKANAVPGTMWEFDVTQIMQNVADGGAWFGFQFTTNNGVGEWFHSSDSTFKYRPQLEIQWSDAPNPPEELSPDGNRAVSLAKPVLRFDFTDVSGSTAMAAMQVQIDAANDFTAPDWDSGEVATSIPELDLATTLYAGLADGATTYWRVRVKDGAGLWSWWSEPAQFRYVSQGVVTINNPGAAPNNYVQESTPPIMWSLGGRTQRAYQIIITDPQDGNEWLWTSGKITSTETGVTLPSGVIKRSDTTYRVYIRTWDDVDREATPGAPAFQEASRDFTLNYSATVSPVTNLGVSLDGSLPWATITWEKATASDSYNIYRDGEVIAVGDFDDFYLGGTSYSFTDRSAAPRRQHTWQVVPVVNGVSASNNPSVSATPRVLAPVLSFPDGTDPVVFLNPDVDAAIAEISDVHEVAGDHPPVLISQASRGFEGSVSGVLADHAIANVSALELRQRFGRLRKRKGQTLLLTVVDESFKCFIKDATYLPRADSDGVYYLASFNFYQVDF